MTEHASLPGERCNRRHPRPTNVDDQVDLNIRFPFQKIVRQVQKPQYL